jgi:hypothetical protein
MGLENTPKKAEIPGEIYQSFRNLVKDFHLASKVELQGRAVVGRSSEQIDKEINTFISSNSKFREQLEDERLRLEEHFLDSDEKKYG